MGDGFSFIHKGVTHKISKIDFDSATGELITLKLDPDHQLARRVLARHIKANLSFNPDNFLRELSEEIKHT